MTVSFADGGLTLAPGRIAMLTINRPERRNAMTRAMWQELPEICDRVATDRNIRVLILRGAGETAFCAGADISEFEMVYENADTTSHYNAAVRNAQARLRDLPQPTLAAISGACFGGGCGLALACDLRFADASARFGITPARLGLAYSPEDTWQLIEKVGVARAKDILFSGRVLMPDEALSFGLIDRLDTCAETAAQDYATSLSRLAPGAMRTIKAVANGLSQPVANSHLQEMFEATFLGAEFREGSRAFLEKRPPDFDAACGEETE